MDHLADSTNNDIAKQCEFVFNHNPLEVGKNDIGTVQVN